MRIEMHRGESRVTALNQTIKIHWYIQSTILMATMRERSIVYREYSCALRALHDVFTAWNPNITSKSNPRTSYDHPSRKLMKRPPGMIQKL
jgi:hypothetical protein